VSYRPACNARGIMSSGSSTAEQGISKPIGFLGSFGNNLADLRGEYEFENTTDAERGGTPRHRYSTRTHSEKKKRTHSTKKSTGKLKVKVTFTKPPLMLSEPSPTSQRQQCLRSSTKTFGVHACDRIMTAKMVATRTQSTLTHRDHDSSSSTSESTPADH